MDTQACLEVENHDSRLRTDRHGRTRMAGPWWYEGGGPPEPVSQLIEHERKAPAVGIDQFQPILVDAPLDLPSSILGDRSLELGARHVASLTFTQVKTVVDLRGIGRVERLARETDGLAIGREADIERCTSFAFEFLWLASQISHVPDKDLLCRALRNRPCGFHPD